MFQKIFLQGLGEFVTFFQKLQNVCEEIADAKYESFMMGITFWTLLSNLTSFLQKEGFETSSQVQVWNKFTFSFSTKQLMVK